MVVVVGDHFDDGEMVEGVGKEELELSDSA